MNSKKLSDSTSSSDSTHRSNVVIDRRTFMKLPMAERQIILAEQADEMVEHYQQDTEWRDWLNFDVEVLDYLE